LSDLFHLEFELDWTSDPIPPLRTSIEDGLIACWLEERPVDKFFSLPLQVRAAVPGPLAGASKQVRSYAAEAKAQPTEVSSILEQRIRGVQEEAGLAETGRVLSVGYVKKRKSLGLPGKRKIRLPDPISTNAPAIPSNRQCNELETN
jgi:hypothetical protein